MAVILNTVNIVVHYSPLKNFPRMTVPHLPNDCIYDILKYLKSHRSTLYNCSLVNRLWCKETIPLFYANPFINLTHKKITQ